MADIKLSFAPMESITGPVFRRVHKEIYGGVDNYFTPFLVANKNHSFKRRETREFIPYDPNLIPQVLASNPQDFIWAAKVLKEAGYSEVNLNLGCPMPTVVTKKKGAGLLRDLDYLDCYLGEIFEGEDLPNISIKTRTGFENSDNAADIGKLYAKYPIAEVIIHPRSREEYYNGTVDMNAFHKMREQLSCPVCYNGDIRSAEDFERLRKEIPDINHFMIGRGLLANSALALEIRGKKDKTGTKILCNYLTVLWDEYVKDSLDEKSILFKMKELWYYLEWRYPEAAEEIKEIKKSKTAVEYKVLVKKVLERLGE